MIPEAKKAAVARALQEAFGVTEFEDIQMLRGLDRHLLFRIVVGGSPYLLRVITRTDKMTDPTRQFACIRSAAGAGLAPRVWYTSIEDRISITDFVEAQPFPIAEAVVRLPVTLRALHALPPFARMNYDTNTSATYLLFRGDGFLRTFQAAKILPESEAEELFKLYTRVTSVYPRHDSEVSSHNDLKPENMVFDGDRVWLVDWEAAFCNDRYSDLAVMANFAVTNDAEEEVYLRTYFGETPDEYRVARFYLMCQLVHMFYAMGFLLIGSSVKPIEQNSKAPDFREFHNRMWAGEVSLSNAETKVQYGRVHLNQVLQNVQAARLQEALRIVSGRHAASV